MCNSGLSKPNPNLAKSSQTKPIKENQRKKTWISLDSLVRIEPFQCVAPTPKAKNLFPAPFHLRTNAQSAHLIGRQANLPRVLIFAKEIATFAALAMTVAP